MTAHDAKTASEGGDRMPFEMQRVALDRDGVPHNIGWMQAASNEDLDRHGARAVYAWQDALREQPGPDRGAREQWWLDRIDDEDRRREGWTEPDLARREQRLTTRRERETATGIAGRAYRALYRLRDEIDQRSAEPLDRYGHVKYRTHHERER